MTDLARDIRYAIRNLGRTPSFTIVAVGTLALAIGATTAVFSIVNGVLLNPLRFARPDRLVLVQSVDPQGQPMSLSPQDMVDYRDQSHSFTGMAAVDADRSMILTSATAAAVRLNGARVGAAFFSLLGVGPELGRTFTPDEDAQSAAKVAVLSDVAWRRTFGADPDILGKHITLNGNAFTVVGVAPPKFTYPGNPDLWFPAVWRDYEIGDKARGYHSIKAIARLRDGVSMETAGRDLATIAGRIAIEFPQHDAKVGALVTSLRDQIVGDAERPLWAMLAATAFVLLIACANVANLLLVRAASRESEMAVRTALGAGRGRLVQQLVTESMLLAVSGAVLGVLVAAWAVRAVVAFGPAGLPRLHEIQIDSRVLAFTTLVGMATGVMFGLVPAMHAGRADLSQMLRAGARGTSRGGQRARSALVLTELSLAMVLFAGAGLFIRSFERLTHVDPGFRPDHLLVFDVVLTDAKYDYDATTNAFTDDVQRRLAHLPGVQSVAVAADRPMDPDPTFSGSTGFTVDGAPKPAPGTEPESRILPVSPSFFQTMGLVLVRGRVFTDAENRIDAAPVIVVNDELARRYFPNEDPIGKHLTFSISHTTTPAPGDTVRSRGEIVGIVKSVRHSSLAGTPGPASYLAYRTAPFGANFIVRTSGDPTTLEPAIRAQLAAADRNVPIYELGTMDAALSTSVSQPRFYTILVGTFGAVALLLAALGIYGVVSYAVSQRVREFGIRIALGATVGDVSRLVVWRGLTLTVAGIGLGTVAGVIATRWIRALLFGTDPINALTFVFVAVVLGVIATAASWLPARRAARVDPVIAMRSD